ncbi:MAG: hypothetical protein AB9866_04825 [Syntrophobacteraceae bacterium]
MLKHDLERLRIRLIRQGMPIRHASRIVGELTAHAEDIGDELIESASPPDELETRIRERLGNLDLIAEEIRECFSRGTFWGRHPVTTFVLLPVVSFSLLILVPILSGSLLISFLDIMKGYGVAYDVDALLALCRKSFDFYRYVFAVASAAWFVCILRRYVYSIKWPAIAAGILAILEFLIVTTLDVKPPVLTGQYIAGSFSLGLGFGLTDQPVIDRLVRFCVPVALFFLMYGRNIWHGYIRTSVASRF